MNKVLVLGYFGYLTNQLDGQTVKTRDVYRLAKEQLTDYDVEYFDTQSLQKSKLLLFKMFFRVMCCKTLFYLPAHNNLKVFFPIIFILSQLFRFNIHYFVVGGWLREYLTNLPIHRFMLARIKGIHAETQRLKKELEELKKQREQNHESQLKNDKLESNLKALSVEITDYYKKPGFDNKKYKDFSNKLADYDTELKKLKDNMPEEQYNRILEEYYRAQGNLEALNAEMMKQLNAQIEEEKREEESSEFTD